MSKTFLITRSKEHRIIQNPREIAHEYGFMGDDDMQVSDGYHTMDELYDHRIALWIALCRMVQASDDTAAEYGGVSPRERVWRSKLHDDGSEYEGWFILGIGKEKGKIMTYHLPNIKWDEVSFADTLERAPEFDGHTAADVLERLKTL